MTLQKLPADRMRALKALVAGGRIEKRRVFPFPAAWHLIRPEVVETPPKVTELAVEDLLRRRLIQTASPVNLSDPRAADEIDYVATLAALRVVKQKGVEVPDEQPSMFGDDAGRGSLLQYRSGMEAA